jgi:uncharacterized Tic20 family protein
MAETAELSAFQPTQHERTMATLAHVLQVVAWWLAPLGIFLAKRESRFVAFHALQALLLQIVYLILCGLFVATWFIGFFVTVAKASHVPNAAPPMMFFVLFPLIWLGLIGIWITLLVVAVVYGIKAGRGEWAEYPLLGGLSRKILKIGPGGSAMSG